MKLWTWQTPEVADTLSRGEVHRAQWHRIDRAGQGAYRAMANEMASAGIDVGPIPPVWLWCDEPDPDTVADRSYQVAREGEPERGLVVLTVEAPDSLVLLSSYSAWIERLADPSSRRPFDPVPDLGPTDLQGCLPYLHPDWVRSSRPLPTDDLALADR
ncbi:hypothetical protein BA895_14155 [Humibacillus sp. DSM 29435]|uniref:hypothetical protein n=1 Tax=Humibacillus sp. DSM 29435 TaxID=1869167 RepID=UPI000872655C|nr:hypothetical protein [Humibacillus sp. DSM 29435]OFE17918.1 hypothetical protein BA895_14155 [Humibacillus sp. DSM 29435]